MKRRFFMREGNVGELRRAGTFCGGNCLLFPRVIAAAVAFLQCDDPLKRTRVARFYCAEFFACHKKRLCSDVLLSDTASFREFVGRCKVQRELFYAKEMAPEGHTSAQVPHSTQTSGSIEYFSPSEIAPTAHSSMQVPHAMQSSLIT